MIPLPSGFRSAVQGLFGQIATPSAPAASNNALYAKTDGQIYTQTPGGVESVLNDTETFVWALSGVMTTRTGLQGLPLGTSYRLVEVRARINTAPTGLALVVDVNKNGTTIYGTQANRPTIAIGGNAATGGTASVTTFAAGDVLTVDVDQVGSTVAGSDLVVAIRLQRTA